MVERALAPDGYGKVQDGKKRGAAGEKRDRRQTCVRTAGQEQSGRYARKRRIQRHDGSTGALDRVLAPRRS